MKNEINAVLENMTAATIIISTGIVILRSGC